MWILSTQRRRKTSLLRVSTIVSILAWIGFLVSWNIPHDINQVRYVREQTILSFGYEGGKTFSSPHLMDCHSVEINPAADIFAQTKTEPSFEMNIHDPELDAFSKYVRDDGCWECDNIKALQRVLLEHPDSYFLDIGGNIGMWTMSVAAMGRESYTIEPFPANTERLCKTVQHNNFHGTTHILRVAATEYPHEFNFPAVDEGNMGSVRISTNGRWASSDIIGHGVPINNLGLPLDKPVVIKLDVEGHEMSALAGALDFLRRADVVFMFTELRYRAIRNQVKSGEIFRTMSAKGLVPYRQDYDEQLHTVETRLDVNNLDEWKHFKHPHVGYFDVVWRKERNQ